MRARCAPALVDVRARWRERRAGFRRCHLVRLAGAPPTARRTSSPATRCTGCTSSRPTGPTTLGSVASVMQADAEQIDGWWRGQDPTRTPRDDLATFPCGDAARHHDRPLLASGCAAGVARRPLLAHLRHACEQAGLTSRCTKYLVYYDGPSDGQRLRSGRRATSDRIRDGRRLLPLVRRRSRPRPSRRTSSCTRPEPSRRARRTLHGRTTGTRATATSTSCTLRRAANRSRRRCSIPDGTTTTATPGRGRLAGLRLAPAPRRSGPAAVNVSGSRIGGRRRAGARVLRQTAPRRGTRASGSC